MKAKFVYVGIRVTDMQRSIEFYIKILGLELINRVKIEETKGEVANLQSRGGHLILELNHYQEGSPYNTKYSVGEGLDHLAFEVDDLDKALEEARSAGVSDHLRDQDEEEPVVLHKRPRRNLDRTDVTQIPE